MAANLAVATFAKERRPMGKIRLIRQVFKLAKRLGPAALIVATKYGPKLQELIKSNPTAVNKITDRLHQVVQSKEQNSNSPKGLAERTRVLKEQVTYLYASANTAEVAKQASEWRATLDSIDRSIPVLAAMSRSKRGPERKALSKRLDALSEEIMAASLADDIEDAEFEEEWKNRAE